MLRMLSFIMCASLLTSCGKSRRDSVFYLPEALRGWVIIFYNEPNGKAIELDGERIVYRIPADGFLTLKFGRDEGFGRESFYLVTRDGRSVPIAAWAKPMEIRARTDGLMREKELGRPVEFYAFFLGTEDELKANPSVDDEVRKAIQRIRR